MSLDNRFHKISEIIYRDREIKIWSKHLMQTCVTRLIWQEERTGFLEDANFLRKWTTPRAWEFCWWKTSSKKLTYLWWIVGLGEVMSLLAYKKLSIQTRLRNFSKTRSHIRISCLLSLFPLHRWCIRSSINGKTKMVRVH